MEEVSENSEKEKPQGSLKKKTKAHTQTRNRQKRKDENVKELEEHKQKKISDVDENLEEVTTGEVHRVEDKATIGDTPNKEHDNSGIIDPRSNPPSEGLKGFMDTMEWLITSHKKAMDDNKKLSHKI